MVQLGFSSSVSKNPACLIVPMFFEKKKFLSTGQKTLDVLLEEKKRADEIETSAGSHIACFPERKSLPPCVIFVAMGEQKKLKAGNVLEHVANGVKCAKAHKKTSIGILIPKPLADFGQTIGEALELTNYNPAKYKTGKEKTSLGKHFIKSCTLITKNSTVKNAVKRGQTIGDAVNSVRDWINGPPSVSSPEFMEETALSLGKKYGYKVTVLKKKELEKLGMGAFLAVNRGSEKEARLIICEYSPVGEKKDSAPIVLVGKGIIFDSGGYNLKPSGYIENMHLDMSGAAAVLGIFQVLKTLNVKHRVVGIMPVTDNAIDAKAIKPSEIVKTYSGKTVEITNTDAEGRLVLCDALAYGIKEYKPRYTVDIATLTGACMVALGEQYAGLFGNDKELTKVLRKSGNETGDLLWPLPIHPAFAKAMKGELSDLQNSESGRYAGASKGAAFLREFVGKSKWAHLDIAGPAYTTSPKSYESKRATGFGVRLLLNFLERI